MMQYAPDVLIEPSIRSVAATYIDTWGGIRHFPYVTSYGNYRHPISSYNQLQISSRRVPLKTPYRRRVLQILRPLLGRLYTSQYNVAPNANRNLTRDTRLHILLYATTYVFRFALGGPILPLTPVFRENDLV